MEPIDNTFKVEALVFWNLRVIAVSSFVVNFNLNAIPTAQVQLALGQPFSADGSLFYTVVTPSEINEGDTIEIRYKHLKTKDDKIGGTIFKGIVSGVQGSKASNATNTSVGAVVSCVHDLAKIGGLAVMSRAHILPSTAVRTVDAYRRKSIKSIFTQINSGRENTLILGPYNSGQYLVEMLIDLYKSELITEKNTDTGEELQSAPREIDTAALAVLEGIKVSDKMVIGIPEDAENKQMKMAIADMMGKQWRNSNGWLTLSRLAAFMEGVVIPTATSAHLVPNFPLSKKAMLTVKANEIFQISARSTMSPIPVVGVRLLYASLDNDAGIKSGGEFYIQYPTADKKIQGVYEYIYPPGWAQFVKKLNIGKVGKQKVISQVGKKSEPGHKKTLLVKDKADKTVSVVDMKKWALKLAKTQYNMKVWARNSFTIDVPFNFNIAPGMVIEIDITADKIAQKIFGDKKLYGQVQFVNIKSAVGMFKMTAGIAYIRNEEENETFGFDNHPLYDAYAMEKIELY